MRPMRASAGGTVIVLTTLVVMASPAIAPPTLEETTTATTVPAAVVVNELAPSDPVRRVDEFVELRNISDQVVGLGGWELLACLSATTLQVAAVFPSSAAIPPDGTYLLTHSGYTGASPPDGHYEVEIPEDGGWLLRHPWSGYSDGVGLSDGLACTEGSPAPGCAWAAGEAVTRDKDGADTGDNSSDLRCQPRTPGR